jgi:branched-chain amino acid transport system ATP-binding protein
VLIEHDMRFALGLTDRVLCLHNGQVVALGSPDELRRDARVQAVYLGRD